MPASTLTESISAARRRAARVLAAASETPALDADLLLAHALLTERATLVTRGAEPLPTEAAAHFNALLARRLAGEPVAYIVGRKSFRDLDLLVDPRVLVPRPETEQMVEIALAWIGRRNDALRVVDVGTGSGAIALALAAEIAEVRPAGASTIRPDEACVRPVSREGRSAGEILATDVSPAALEVARENATRLGLAGRVRFVESDLLEHVEGEFDLILANLPYLRGDQRDPSTRAEPELALYAGADGFDIYRRFLPQAAVRLRAGGLIVIEIDPAQSGFGAQEAKTSTGLAVEVIDDLAGRARFLVIGDAV